MRNPSNPASPRAFRPDRPRGAHPTPPPIRPATSALATDIASFRRHLAARNLSPKTERTYIDAAALFDAFLARSGLPAALPGIRREHVEAFIADQLARFNPEADVVDGDRLVVSPMQQAFKGSGKTRLLPVSAEGLGQAIDFDDRHWRKAER